MGMSELNGHPCHQHREILSNYKDSRRLTSDELRNGVGSRVVVAQSTVLDEKGTRMNRSRNLSKGEYDIVEDLCLSLHQHQSWLFNAH
jgi:hypothetical protein